MKKLKPLIKCTITFEDANSEERKISYNIYYTGISKKWINMLLANKKDKEKYIHTSLFNSSYLDIPRLHKNITKTIKAINSVYDIQLPEYVDSVLNKTQLNDLHFMFEKYGDRIEADRSIFKENIHINFLRLNEDIHSYETALDNDASKFPDMTILLDYFPQTIFEDVQPIDKIYLKNNFQWGELYLGYNTLGKDWLAAVFDRDLDLINREEIRPQIRYAAETWLCFNGNPVCISNMQRFETFYNSLPDETKAKVPLDKLSEMALGRFILGEVIIDDEFLKFDSNIDNWKVPNSKTKQKWNEEVFSTFRKVVNIEINKEGN